MNRGMKRRSRYVGANIGEHLAKIAREQDILLRVCDRCAIERGLGEGDFSQCGLGHVQAKGFVEGVVAGCFPQLYAALAESPPDQVITL